MSSRFQNSTALTHHAQLEERARHVGERVVGRAVGREAERGRRVVRHLARADGDAAAPAEARVGAYFGAARKPLGAHALAHDGAEDGGELRRGRARLGADDQPLRPRAAAHRLGAHRPRRGDVRARQVANVDREPRLDGRRAAQPAGDEGAAERSALLDAARRAEHRARAQRQQRYAQPRAELGAARVRGRLCKLIRLHPRTGAARDAVAAGRGVHARRAGCLCRAAHRRHARRLHQPRARGRARARRGLGHRDRRRDHLRVGVGEAALEDGGRVHEDVSVKVAQRRRQRRLVRQLRLAHRERAPASVRVGQHRADARRAARPREHEHRVAVGAQLVRDFAPLKAARPRERDAQAPCLGEKPREVP